MGERLDRVTIALPRGDIEISWAARNALLDEIRPLTSAAAIVQAFEAVGATRPVEMNAEQRGQLHMLINEWSRRAQREGTNLPEGIWALRKKLAYS